MECEVIIHKIWNKQKNR